MGFVFDNIKAASDFAFKLQVSYLEIYKEEIKDLLGPKNSKTTLAIREGKQGIFVANLQWEEVMTKTHMPTCTHVHTHAHLPGNICIAFHAAGAMSGGYDALPRGRRQITVGYTYIQTHTDT